MPSAAALMSSCRKSRSLCPQNRNTQPRLEEPQPKRSWDTTETQAALFIHVSFCFHLPFFRVSFVPLVSFTFHSGDQRVTEGAMMARVTSLADHFSPQLFSGSRSWRNRSRRIRIGKSNQRSVEFERSPHEQADSHRQKLDRKVRKSPVIKSMEDGLIRLQGKIERTSRAHFAWLWINTWSHFHWLCEKTQLANGSVGLSGGGFFFCQYKFYKDGQICIANRS